MIPTILLLILSFILFVFTVRFIDLIGDYHKSYVEEAPYLNYNMIKNIYIVNPKKINIKKEVGWHTSYKFYIIEIKNKKDSNWGYYDTSKIYFNTKFFTWVYLVHCYKKYKKTEYIQNVTEKQKENLLIILNSIQTDIDKLQKQSQEEINLAQNVNNQVKENINNEQSNTYA